MIQSKEKIKTPSLVIDKDNSIYIQLNNNKVKVTRHQGFDGRYGKIDMNLDFDRKGKVIRIEILGLNIKNDDRCPCCGRKICSCGDDNVDSNE